MKKKIVVFHISLFESFTLVAHSQKYCNVMGDSIHSGSSLQDRYSALQLSSITSPPNTLNRTSTLIVEDLRSRRGLRVFLAKWS
jgi:hypothetical protein